MSWAIQSIGRVKNVRAEITKRAASLSDEQSKAATAFIFGELDKIPPPNEPDNGYQYNGVNVDASGHSDSLSRNCSISIRMVRVAPETAQAERTPEAFAATKSDGTPAAVPEKSCCEPTSAA